MAKHETTVVLKAKDQTKRALKSAQNELRDTEKAAGALVGSIRAIAPAFLAAFSVSSATSFIRNLVQQQRELTGLAAASDLAISDLLAYGRATQTVGVSTEQFADIVKDVNDKLGDFLATGGGGFKDFFDLLPAAIRPSAEELAKLSGPKVLIAVKKALDAANISAKEQIFVLESIGNDASKLIPILAREGEKFEELADNARKANEALNELQRADIAAAGQKIEEAQTQAEKFFNNVAASSASTVGAIVKFFGGAFIQFNASFFEPAEEQLQNLQEEAEGLRELLQTKIATGGIAFALRDLQGEFDEVNRKIRLLQKELSGGVSIVSRYAEGMAEVAIAAEEAKAAIAKGNDVMTTAISQAELFAKAFESAKDNAEGIANAVKTIKGVLEERGAADKPTTTLDALITSSKARRALATGDTGAAAKFAAQAAQQFAAIEEREGPQLQFGGFIKNQLAIAEEAGRVSPFEEAQKTLRLEIAIGDETKSFAFTEEGVKQAGKFASDLSRQLKKAEKTKNRTTR